MAFKIVKWLYAIKASIHGFAGRGGKLADKLRMMRITTGALNGFFIKDFFSAKLLFGIWWGYAVFF